MPYIAAHDVLPAILGGSAEGDESEELVVMVQRRIYPFLLLLIISVAAIVMQLKQFRKLYEHIKNDRLVASTEILVGDQGMLPGIGAARAAQATQAVYLSFFRRNMAHITFREKRQFLLG